MNAASSALPPRSAAGACEWVSIAPGTRFVYSRGRASPRRCVDALVVVTNLYSSSPALARSRPLNARRTPAGTGRLYWVSVVHAAGWTRESTLQAGPGSSTNSSKSL